MPMSSQMQLTAADGQACAKAVLTSSPIEPAAFRAR
jgi:hypothetical protein